MTLLLLVALLAPPAPDLPPPDTTMTAGQLYDGCARYAANSSASSLLEGDAAICARTATVRLVAAAVEAAAQDAVGGPDPRTACPPRSLLDSDDAIPLARLFIAYVDHNPASRGTNANEVFERALAEKWPCRG